MVYPHGKVQDNPGLRMRLLVWLVLLGAGLAGLAGRDRWEEILRNTV